jgi:coenzyme F420 hydrogenase subunit beta
MINFDIRKILHSSISLDVKDKIYALLEKKSIKNWDNSHIETYIGHYKKAYTGYSTLNSLRINAASGACTTQILKTALEKNLIQGALVCKTSIWNNKVRPKIYIAKTIEELLDSQGSTYVLTDYMKKAPQLIKDFDGNLGIVGLPCEIKSIKKLAAKNQAVKNKIAFTISLFCGHTSDTELIDAVTQKLLKTYSSPLKNYVFRKGHWRGKLQAVLENGTIVERHSFYYNQYQNLFFHCSFKCFSCFDQFGYDADINVGDAWLIEYKKNPIKHNILIAKTKKGLEIIDDLKNDNILKLHQIPITKVLDAQSRSVLLHYNVSSRHKMGKMHGMSIPDRVKQKTTWHQNLLAWLILFNWRWSKSKRAHWIFKMPQPVVTLYLYFFKLLQIL